MQTNGTVVKLVLFDLDGTIYLGDKLLPGVKKLLRRLRGAQIDYGFMTNNSSRSPEQYLRKLRRLGLTVTSRNIITSAQASCLMLRDLELGPEIFILGTRQFRNYLARQGYRHRTEKATAVLVGFDMELNHRDLTTATRLVLNGLPLVASHTDVLCPSPDGPLPDAGMFLAAIKKATATNPCAVAGKPHRWIVQVVCERFQVKPRDILIVGDRLETDIRMAHKYRMKSVLVTSGVTTRSQVRKSRYRPDLIVDSLGQLADEYWLAKLGWMAQQRPRSGPKYTGRLGN